MSSVERTLTVILCFSIIGYILWADKPMVLATLLINVIVAVIANDPAKISTGTTIVNGDSDE